MTDNFYGGNRDGVISLDEAKNRFIQYYNDRAKSNIGRFRAKLFDMMYQKKPEKTLKPGEPGSIRYNLEEGPRTFDMEGVDWFPEGEIFTVLGEDQYTDSYTSKGATNKRATNKLAFVDLTKDVDIG